MSFKAPTLNLEPLTVAEIPFEGTVANGAYLTLVSGYIPFKYRVVRVKIFFTAAAASLVRVRFYVSRNSMNPTTGWPGDTNLFGRLSPTATFIGQSLIREAPANIEVQEEGTFLKMAAYNTSGAAYQVNGAIRIEEIKP